MSVAKDMMSLSILCHCSCGDSGQPVLENELRPDRPELSPLWMPSRPREEGLISYAADSKASLSGPTLKKGAVYHLVPDDDNRFQEVDLTLLVDGLRIEPAGGGITETLAWSPFALVQACRLHSHQADVALSWLRLFKVSIFQHGNSHFFACWGEEADAERARWVAEISRAIRVLTHSLFPQFLLRTDPLPGASWTATRLVAGYLALCEEGGVSCVYCELHAHWESTASFVAYEDEYCETRVMRLELDMHTCVSERVGVDCSCFSFDGYHFAARTCAEKMLWLRALSNVKVKLRHRAPNPVPNDLEHYRNAVKEYAQLVQTMEDDTGYQQRPLLPRRVHPRCGGGRGTGPASVPGGASTTAATRPIAPLQAGLTTRSDGSDSTSTCPGGSHPREMGSSRLPPDASTSQGALVLADSLQDGRFPRLHSTSRDLPGPRPQMGGRVEEWARSTEQPGYPTGPRLARAGAVSALAAAVINADPDAVPPDPSEPLPIAGAAPLCVSPRPAPVSAGAEPPEPPPSGQASRETPSTPPAPPQEPVPAMVKASLAESSPAPQHLAWQKELVSSPWSSRAADDAPTPAEEPPPPMGVVGVRATGPAMLALGAKGIAGPKRRVLT